MEISLYPAYNVLSKMIHADPEMRKDIVWIGGTSQWHARIFRGIDQWGGPYGYILVDPIGGAIGAFATGDGISTGGQSRTPICKLPNVEHTEQTFPLLFLYRKEVIDSGGAGRFRGGLSAESCFIPHHTHSITQDTLSSGNAMPTSPGMMAGYPGSVNVYKFKRVTDNLELRSEKSGLRCACAKCAADLGAVRENYKEHCVRRESDISAANPNIGDYRRYIDDRPVFRQFFCPGCGALIENEIARADDAVLHDIEIDLA